MPTVPQIALHNKLTKMLKVAHSNSRFTSNSRPLENFQFAHNLYVIFISYMQLHFLKVTNITILTKINKNRSLGNNVGLLSKSRCQTRTSLLTQQNKIPCSYCMI